MQQAEPHRESWRSGEKNALLTRRRAAGLWPRGQIWFHSLPKGPNHTKRRFDGAAGED